jgi:hypothetical protein
MTTMTTAVEIFVNNDDESGYRQSVGLMLRDPSIVECDGELIPGCSLTPAQARRLAAELMLCAEEVETAA